jgi:hypothetical protein
MRSSLIVSFVFASLVAGCGNGGTHDLPDMSMASSARCTMPVAPTCTDEQIQDLTLFKTTSTRMITNTAEGSGWASEIDATGGAGTGITPKESYVYAKFTDQGLTPVAISDEAAFNSLDWDIAFRRFIIRLNSGVSGPSCVDGARTGPSTDFDTLAAEPAGLDYRVEQYYTAACSLVPDGSGLGSPGTALQSFWKYTMCLQMSGNVYVVRLADGKKVKLVVSHYYTQAVQDECDSTNAIQPGDASASAHVGVRWGYIQ